jgi:hypothetical protein
MSAVADVWNRISSSVDGLKDRDTREKYENIAVMIGSVGLAKAIPGFGEAQLASMFIDFIDPYGYNQAITRKTLDKILPDQYSKIQEMSSSAVSCYQGDQKACDDSKITPEEVKAFQSLDPAIQQKQLRSINSWLTPYPPEVNFPEMVVCQLQTDPTRMSGRCKDNGYSKLYLDYYSGNQDKYKANADKAHQEWVDQMAKSLSGGGDAVDTHNSEVKNSLLIVMIIGYLVAIYCIWRISSSVFD